MKKIFDLTINELTKQVKKRSFKVILGIILITAIILPIGINLFKKESGNDLYKSTEAIVKQYRGQYDELAKSNKVEDKIVNNSIKAQLESWSLKLESDFKQDDWREEAVQEYEITYNYILALKEVENGTNKDVLLKFVSGVDPSEVERYYSLSNEERNKELDKLNRELKKYKKIVLTKDYVTFLNDKNIELKNRVIEDKNELISLTKEKSTAKEVRKDEIDNRIVEVENEINRLENSISINEFRLNNKISYDDGEWKNNTLLDLSKLNDEVYMLPQNEENFNKEMAFSNSKMTYNEYIEKFSLDKIKMKNSIEKDWYSLKNNIPQIDFIKDARSVVINTYDIFIIIAILVVIILGGGIVANEFSKGTIRLLAIRPISRWKILLSKLLALLVIGVSIVLGSVIVLLISSGSVYGFDTLKTPILEANGNSIFEVSYLGYFIKNISLSLSGLLFVTGLVFMLSTVTKNTAISVAVSMLIYLGALPITLILASNGVGGILKTFIPYIDYSIFNLVDVFKEMIVTNTVVQLSPEFGSIQLLIGFVIMSVISVIVFIKNDIKN